MSKIKYILVPTYMISDYDGEEHYISARALISVYGVNPNECIDGSDPQKLRGYSKERLREFVRLYPQQHYEDYEKIRREILV